ncbi:hypothetical protein EIP86_001102, partial [Pleurotus ostreatoroseus]
MPIRLAIPTDLQHPAHLAPLPDIIQPEGLRFAGTSEVLRWVIKLEWREGADIKVGTGFFLNIPGSPAHDVLLTAAHNLVSPSNIPSQNLRAFLPRIQTDPADPSQSWVTYEPPYSVPQSATHVCASYDPSVPTYGTDWGFIRLPPDSALEYGFGYSIRLGYEERLLGDLNVTGYRADSKLGAPATSTGVCVSCYDNQLEYRVQTEQGISGSPVWYEYKGRPTVVGIHNARPRSNHAKVSSRRTAPGSHGAFITLALLSEVFDVLGVGRKAVQLRAREPPKPKGRTAKKVTAAKIPDIPSMPAAGLFLSFTPAHDFARVKLGRGSLFDIFPVSSTSGERPDIVILAMRMDTKWVYFNPAARELSLVDTLSDACLFTERNIKAKRKAMRVVVGEREGEQYQLRIQGYRINELDGDDAVSSEVSLVLFPDANNDS